YKDYILTLLFVKYVSDKYAGKPNALINVPTGASFQDMIAMKGQPDIGDRINKEVLAPLFAAIGVDQKANKIQPVDFNDEDKLGEGKVLVDRVSKLIAIFENEGLNFEGNRAEDDDILGDAYEYLMRHFATESGKSKGQFYTPSEVSRILASIIDVEKADNPRFSAYDPTCGSGSLLLKVANRASVELSLYGQEKDVSTKSLAVMNMWLHNQPTSVIMGGDTLSKPQFLESENSLKRFDFVVANPPFSLKNWSTGITPESDTFNRFPPKQYGIPPEKNGDYAFLLHIIASLKSTGKGAVILPHGVLFRGNAEAFIRENLIRRKLIKGIIGLPANLFYGTGIPACIIVLDKEGREAREGIFMIDASKGYKKDGNKNRLREQDIHMIVDTFNNRWEIDKYARMVSIKEIEKNEFNLNIPRYIDTQEEEDIQDLDAHLNGGIPLRDIDALQEYWQVYPDLRRELFEPMREGYAQLKLKPTEIREAILSHPQFKAYQQELDKIFKDFAAANLELLGGIHKQTAPKQFIVELSEDLLKRYAHRPLIDRYDTYQHLMDYWEETMKDDLYLIVEEGWVARTYRIIEKDKKGKEKDKGWTCDLLPKPFIVQAYFAEEEVVLKAKKAELDTVQAELANMEEEHAGEEGLLAEVTNDKGKLNKTILTQYLKDAKNLFDTPSIEEEALILMKEVKKRFDQEAKLKKEIKSLNEALDEAAYQKYKELSEEEVHKLVIHDKWLPHLKQEIQGEIDAISQRLSTRIKELAERYEQTLGELNAELEALGGKVEEHLRAMGLSW
ncbi:MAG: type I restriction-modification system subunit M, partial [Bacteroidota bacterium]